MKATVESTDQIVTIEGYATGRVWKGITEGGVAFELLVTRVAVDKDADVSQFERELKEQHAPHVSLAFPLRLIL